jgi:Putative zinc ribbon domain
MTLRQTEYCGYCYQSGKFTEPNLSCEEMISKVKMKLKEMKIPGFIANYFAKEIPQLKPCRAMN